MIYGARPRIHLPILATSDVPRKSGVFSLRLGCPSSCERGRNTKVPVFRGLVTCSSKGVRACGYRFSSRGSRGVAFLPSAPSSANVTTLSHSGPTWSSVTVYRCAPLSGKTVLGEERRRPSLPYLSATTRCYHGDRSFFPAAHIGSLHSRCGAFSLKPCQIETA